MSNWVREYGLWEAFARIGRDRIRSPSIEFEQFQVIARNHNPQCLGMDWWRLQKRRLIDMDSEGVLIPILMVYYEKCFESALCCISSASDGLYGDKGCVRRAIDEVDSCKN